VPVARAAFWFTRTTVVEAFTGPVPSFATENVAVTMDPGATMVGETAKLTTRKSGELDGGATLTVTVSVAVVVALEQKIE